MKTSFEELLTDIAIEFDTTLSIDENESCSILFDGIITVQLEINEEDKSLIIFSPICQIPPGTFRENVLLSALKENDKFPYIGIFGFSTKTTELTLHNKLKLRPLTKEMLISFLTLFVDSCINWKEAIDSGRSAPISKQ
ncbi:MAG: CesT family type III secretion system chaperone [Parachlamydiales bacterium]|nr:CesT family type III secretion system chaperone [Parachlamydiales bacterium]